MYTKEIASCIHNAILYGVPFPDLRVLIARWNDEHHVQNDEHDKHDSEREAFNSLFGNLPRDIESLLLVAHVQSGLNPLEVFGMYDLLREGKLPPGLRDIKVLLSGLAATQCGQFINLDLPEGDLRLTVGIWDNDAAFEEFHEDFPDEEDEDYDMVIEGSVGCQCGAW
jgi:hypothetical protein